ncbi:hypothetical protein P153DRAFT_227815 [Dothidotthia symphoricarpi CBS 119687]|uniref:Uncharacterized protein n=1 Tax=Dothidotthia symphoricarpi CBS 119687 TaxID=1392245 RepID=A0A6A6ADI9_9PLEO|nr:uncharacterized protein P153DRAFT_227815 [Dothidotthia symphoricarpi CBS 119687]KAF2129952.1 hypothetical protein P153DRAFT_227815 [Dothidotthia symphoricarpi CBS 119687]
MTRKTHGRLHAYDARVRQSARNLALLNPPGDTFEIQAKKVASIYQSSCDLPSMTVPYITCRSQSTSYQHVVPQTTSYQTTVEDEAISSETHRQSERMNTSLKQTTKVKVSPPTPSTHPIFDDVTLSDVNHLYHRERKTMWIFSVAFLLRHPIHANLFRHNYVKYWY